LALWLALLGWRLPKLLLALWLSPRFTLTLNEQGFIEAGPYATPCEIHWRDVAYIGLTGEEYGKEWQGRVLLTFTPPATRTESVRAFIAKINKGKLLPTTAAAGCFIREYGRSQQELYEMMQRYWLHANSRET